MVAQATVPVPFKGESFPAYVVNRTSGLARRLSAPSPSTTAEPSTQQQVAAKGPSQGMLVKHCAKLHPAHEATSSTPVISALGSSAVTGVQTPTLTRSRRPSLTEQLQAISLTAHNVTTQLRSSYQLEGTAIHSRHQQSGVFVSTAVHAGECLLNATTVHLSVGRLVCRFPCPVQFAADRCSYLFQHPFEPKEIHMTMFYRDMRHTQLSVHERSLRFRIDHPLVQFGDDYRPSNPNHDLKVVFATASEAQKVKHFFARQKSSFGSAQEQ
jgi:hypothetical protein